MTTECKKQGIRESTLNKRDEERIDIKKTVDSKDQGFWYAFLYFLNNVLKLYI